MILVSLVLQAVRGRRALVVNAKDGKTVVIGLAADSGAQLVLGFAGIGAPLLGVSANVRSGLSRIAGCGKSTFMRRMTSIFGGSPKPPAGVQRAGSASAGSSPVQPATPSIKGVCPWCQLK